MTQEFPTIVVNMFFAQKGRLHLKGYWKFKLSWPKRPAGMCLEGAGKQSEEGPGPSFTASHALCPLPLPQDPGWRARTRIRERSTLSLKNHPLALKDKRLKI